MLTHLLKQKEGGTNK